MKTIVILKEFLISREYDIFLEMEDFGGLKEVFIELIGREPKDVSK